MFFLISKLPIKILITCSCFFTLFLNKSMPPERYFLQLPNFDLTVRYLCTPPSEFFQPRKTSNPHCPYCEGLASPHQGARSRPIIHLDSRHSLFLNYSLVKHLLIIKLQSSLLHPRPVSFITPSYFLNSFPYCQIRWDIPPPGSISHDLSWPFLFKPRGPRPSHSTLPQGNYCKLTPIYTTCPD